MPKRRIRRRAMPFELKALDVKGQFSGYGSVFGTLDSYNERVAPGAFAKTIDEHMSRDSAPAMLWQHRPDTVIGSYSVFREDERGLYVEGQLALGVQKGREAYELMNMEPPGVRGLSIGFMPIKEEVDNETGEITLTEIDLWEVSVVTFPANADAEVETVRAALSGDNVPTVRDVELILRDAGFSRLQSKRLLAQGYRGLMPRDAVESLDAAKHLLKTLRGN